MKRREFITLLGGAAAAWPLAARAQQPEQMRRIGVLLSTAADDPESSARTASFLQGLQQLGWIEGRNLRIDIRWAAGDAELYRKYAADGKLELDEYKELGGMEGSIRQTAEQIMPSETWP